VRALTGPAVMLTMVVGFTAYRVMSKEDAPSREFTGLELSLPGGPGSCYSLSTTFIANGVFGKTARTWKKAGDEAWSLTVERVVEGRGGPTREFTTWTFERHGKAVELVRVEASPGLPQDPGASLTELLHAPNSMRSTPVERCLEPGATGYLFRRK
jgi:hypothetical protein